MTLLESLWRTFLSITVVDVIDIVLVTFILYHLLVLMRRSGAVSLLKGVAAVIVIVSITTWLPTFNWLMSRLLVPGIIALVVIFQPELRIALERLGRAGFLGQAFSNMGLGTEGRQLAISEVIEAVAGFSESHTGALIVFERETGLMDITRTGKTLNARVSAELLASIFHLRSPLHDGAVVIRGSTLIAAACVLPYSESLGLSASAGMRHRAALGISEKTDAVCVVVSEETGVLSLAVDGALNRRLDRTQLTERLMGLFEQPAETPKLMFWKR
jgi:diadenylate cyclase